jgi:hypothetical protein
VTRTVTVATANQHDLSGPAARGYELPEGFGPKPKREKGPASRMKETGVAKPGTFTTGRRRQTAVARLRGKP